METPLTNPRFDLAAARAVLRAAEDGEATLKAIISGQAQGTNDTARKADAARLLVESDDYQDALRELRAAQAAVDYAAAAVDIASDELRRAELAARERLAEALLGKRIDNAAIDRACTCDECLARREEAAENYAKGFPFEQRQTDDWRVEIT